MASNIFKVLMSLGSVKEHHQKTEALNINYRSQLAIFASRAPRLPSQPKDSAIKEAVDAWNQSNESNYRQLPKRIIRRLCCVSTIARTKAFITLLKEFDEPISPRMVRDLLGVYFGNWPERHSSPDFETFLSTCLSTYTGTSKLMLGWKANLNELIGDEAPKRVAKLLALQLATVDSFFDKLLLPRQHARFTNAVVGHLGSELVKQLNTGNQPNLNIWTYTRDYLLKLPTLRKEQLDALLAQIIHKIDEYRSLNSWELVKDDVCSFVLTHPELGDPRMESTKWKTFDPHAKLIFSSWLTEEDISLFFELIIQNDPHDRKPYWLRYAKQALNSMVIIGTPDYDLHKIELQKLRKEGRVFSRGFGIKASAFILDFGKIAVVEFSEVNNACYVYQKELLPELLKTTQGGWKDMRYLKDREKAIHTQSHHSTWKNALDVKMLDYNIQPSNN